MQKFQDVVLDSQGRPVAGAVIAVQAYPGGGAATVYQTDAVGTAYTPITDDYGAFYFYAPDGNYSYTVTVNGVLRKTVTDVEIVDTIDALAGKASLAGATYTGVVAVPLGSVSLPSYTFSGDTNTGIYSTGADALGISVGGTAAIRIGSTGNVTIGGAPGNGRLLVQNSDDCIIQSSGSAGYGSFAAYGSSGNPAYLFLYSGGSEVARITGLPGNILLFSNGPSATERIRISSDGFVTIGFSSGNSSGAKLQVVDGVTFPAIDVASSDANTLDDYQEGTWTPVDESGATLSLTASDCVYTKIGRVVHVQGTITYPVTASGTGARVGGLPFATRSGTRTAIEIGGYTDSSIDLAGHSVAANASFILYTRGTNTAVTNAQLSTFGFAVNATYEV